MWILFEGVIQVARFYKARCLRLTLRTEALRMELFEQGDKNSARPWLRKVIVGFVRSVHLTRCHLTPYNDTDYSRNKILFVPLES